ncbi:MAG: hypothetical protein U9R56_01645, partial [candidate division Zixibacteria bacterium]|nr:hypothetical protein [candidate division Zixibacteria bacterium]
TQSYGPETITIKQITGPCKFAVHNFSGGSETAILSSSAHIDVYQGSSKIAEYDIPSSGTGYWWYVCDMEGSGDLAAVNEIQVDAPEGFTSPPYDKP